MQIEGFRDKLQTYKTEIKKRSPLVSGPGAVRAAAMRVLGEIEEERFEADIYPLFTVDQKAGFEQGMALRREIQRRKDLIYPSHLELSSRRLKASIKRLMKNG